MDSHSDKPYRYTLSVTMTMQHAKACTTQALSPHLQGPDIGSLHMMPPTPHLGLSIEAEATALYTFSWTTPAAASCLHVMLPKPQPLDWHQS